MNLKCGIVGLPNVGKSSLFNTLTAQAIPAENYPFCTIEPNVGIVQIPDKKLDEIAFEPTFYSKLLCTSLDQKNFIQKF